MNSPRHLRVVSDHVNDTTRPAPSLAYWVTPRWLAVVGGLVFVTTVFASGVVIGLSIAGY